MVFFETQDIERWIGEDVPSIDLTSELLGIAHQEAVLLVRTRHPQRVALTEEARRIFEILGTRVTRVVPSGQDVGAGVALLEARGAAGALHRGWKVAMNLLEHGCGVATLTAEFVARARSVADIPILVTRKHWPGLKKVMINAILAGGAHPHRLGLSETILVFDNHLALVGGRSALPAVVARMRAAACEKKIAVECHDLAEAEQAVAAGADVIQFDKVPAAELAAYCARIRAASPRVALTAAGGIALDDVRAYAATGVDALVLSSVYHARPADLGVTIEPA